MESRYKFPHELKADAIAAVSKISDQRTHDALMAVIEYVVSVYTSQEPPIHRR